MEHSDEFWIFIVCGPELCPAAWVSEVGDRNALAAATAGQPPNWVEVRVCRYLPLSRDVTVTGGMIDTDHREMAFRAQRGVSTEGRYPVAITSTTYSANASDAVSPGDSIPNRLIKPRTP